MTKQLAAADVAILEDAFRILEHPSLAVRLSSAVGMPLEAVTSELGKRAPEAVVDIVNKSTRKALEVVIQSSVRSLRNDEQIPASPRLHTAAALTTGAVGGFFGISTLPVELPVTTGIMFRSIVDIARAEGEAPGDPETLLNCMQVFAIGSSTSDKDDAAESSYYGIRVALGKALNDAMQYVAAYGVGSASAPVLVRLIGVVAHRFGIVVTQKALAQAMPVLGAIGGGFVNTIFISHFQDMARGHFAIRRLEQKYGEDLVQDAYRSLRSDENLPI